MLRLEQIKLLESKVNKAVEIISKLREENRTLRAGLTSAQKKIDELEDLVNSFKSEQEEIEEGIIRALNSLDKLEDEIQGEGKKERDESIMKTETSIPETSSPEKNVTIEKGPNITNSTPKGGISSNTPPNSQLDIF